MMERCSNDPRTRYDCNTPYLLCSRLVGGRMGLKLMPLILSLILATNGAAARDWTQDQHQVLASPHNQNAIGRLEVMASQNCTAVELRLWAEISEIPKDALDNQETLALSFLLSDMQIASAGQLLKSYQGINGKTDLVYIRLGYWAWDVINYLPKNSDESNFTLITEDYELASNNTWPVGNLSDQLRHLKSDCDSDFLGTLL